MAAYRAPQRKLRVCSRVVAVSLSRTSARHRDSREAVAVRRAVHTGAFACSAEI